MAVRSHHDCTYTGRPLSDASSRSASATRPNKGQVLFQSVTNQQEIILMSLQPPAEVCCNHDTQFTTKTRLHFQAEDGKIVSKN